MLWETAPSEALKLWPDQTPQTSPGCGSVVAPGVVWRAQLPSFMAAQRPQPLRSLWVLLSNPKHQHFSLWRICLPTCRLWHNVFLAMLMLSWSVSYWVQKSAVVPLFNCSFPIVSESSYTNFWWCLMASFVEKPLMSWVLSHLQHSGGKGRWIL